MVGPIAGAKVTESANSARPIGCCALRQLGQHHGEGHRDQHAAGEALQAAHDDHRAEIVREGAGHREQRGTGRCSPACSARKENTRLR